MDRIELVPMLCEVFERVPLVELERVTRLRVNIYPHNVEAGPRIPGTGSPCATKQV
jgi:hypothetical protein